MKNGNTFNDNIWDPNNCMFCGTPLNPITGSPKCSCFSTVISPTIIDSDNAMNNLFDGIPTTTDGILPISLGNVNKVNYNNITQSVNNNINDQNNNYNNNIDMTTTVPILDDLSNFTKDFKGNTNINMQQGVNTNNNYSTNFLEMPKFFEKPEVSLEVDKFQNNSIGRQPKAPVINISTMEFSNSKTNMPVNSGVGLDNVTNQILSLNNNFSMASPLSSLSSSAKSLTQHELSPSLDPSNLSLNDDDNADSNDEVGNRNRTLSFSSDLSLAHSLESKRMSFSNELDHQCIQEEPIVSFTSNNDIIGDKTKVTKVKAKQKSKKGSTKKLSSNNKREVKCEICGKLFVNNAKLKSHSLTHSDAKPYKCQSEGCNQAFARHSDLRRHEKTVHATIGDVTSRRQVCGGWCKGIILLNNIRNIGEDENEWYEPSIVEGEGTKWGCGDEFLRMDGLIKHWRESKVGKECLASLMRLFGDVSNTWDEETQLKIAKAHVRSLRR